MRRRRAQLGMVQSMNRPEANKMIDNALMESFFHSMKAEGVHGRTFPDQQRLHQHVTRYIPFYNVSGCTPPWVMFHPSSLSNNLCENWCLLNRVRIPPKSGAAEARVVRHIGAHTMSTRKKK